ncbi:MFS transporter [Nesterenkonia sp. AN1]|uniref:Sugar phosphate permease n=1 Tax=Nesterenkonia aurantiaca TaxID=1436010 RepID=A0A4R7FZD1_9MICC|nr:MULTISPECIES: MFS transporter [Nesterenkonia]EXF25791.1 MFS transporter [Nesterenkonia sp. AN1]TDS84263.1 sugar phosphate permease [Nesterenkonia aurantiaca]
MSTPAVEQPKPMAKIPAKQTVLVTVICFVAWSIAVYDYILFGTLLPRIEESFGWTQSFALLVSTLASAAIFIVIIIFGPLVDRMGRRKGMMASVGGTAVAGVATAAVQGATSVVAVRGFTGLGLAEQNVNGTYLNEIFAQTESKRIKRNQGFFYSLVQSGWPVGALLAAGFVALTAHFFGAENWRVAFLLSIIPSIVVFALIYFLLKETPQFTTMKKIRDLRKAGKPEEAEALSAATGLRVEKEVPLKRIFNGKHRRNTIVLSLAWTLNWFGIATFSVLGTSVLESGKGVDADSALLMIVGANLVGALGYLTHGFLGDKFGRKNVVVVGWLIAGVAFAVMMLGPNNPEFVLPLYMVGLFFLLGPYAAIMYFQAECYDADCRATGSAFISAFSQPGAVIGGFILTALVAAAFEFATAALVVGAIGTFVSGLVMLFAKKVETDVPREEVPIPALRPTDEVVQAARSNR